MIVINNAPIASSANYEAANILSSANVTRDTDSGANQNIESFSGVLDNKLREQALQSAMTRSPGLPNMTGGIGGMNHILGDANPTAISREIESTFITTARSGEMSGAQIMIFMMVLMMQSGDGGSDMMPLMQMFSGMLMESRNDMIADNQYNRFTFTDMEGETPAHLRRMVDVALEQVGYRERNIDGSQGNGNATKFGAWYGMNGQPWCAMFVSWAADQVGVLGDVVPKHASTARGVEAYKERGSYASRQSGYLPREGDAIFFQSSAGTIRHVGIVVGYDPNTQKIYTVEGNTDNSVRIRNYDLNSDRIHGYGQNGGAGFGRIPSSSTSGVGANVL